MTAAVERYDATVRPADAQPRVAKPPPLTPSQLGPAAKPGICAYAPVRGCGLETATFYIGGWRCGRCGP